MGERNGRRFVGIRLPALIDRQVLLRTAQGTKNLTLRREQQVAALTVVGCILGWCVVATLGVVAMTYHSGDLRQHIADLEIGYTELISDVARRNGSEVVLETLSGGSDIVDRMMTRQAEQADRIATLQAALAARDEAIATLTHRLDARDVQRAAATEELRAARTAQAEATRRIETLEATAEALRGERRDLQLTLSDSRDARQALDAALTEAETWNRTLEEQINDLTLAVRTAQTTVDHLAAERDRALAGQAAADAALHAAQTEALQVSRAFRAARTAGLEFLGDRDRLADEVGRLTGIAASLERELATVRQGQEQLFARLRERTERHIGDMEAGLALTGLDIDGLVQGLRAEFDPGRGGPMVPSLPPSLREAEAMRDARHLLLAVDRAATLRDVANTIPIGRPLGDGYRLSSGFGTRRDPFTGRSARHLGLDFAGAAGGRIVATAPGAVSYAGRRGAYGNMVEVDHGMGLTTRYAHLQSIAVEVGQRVGYGDVVGTLGSTGRSTGPHLHYEVRYNDVALNPMNFLKAGQHVLTID